MSAADNMRQTLMDMGEGMAAFIEFAEGQKAELVRRGWSAETAEAYGAEILLGMVRQMFGAMR